MPNWVESVLSIHDIPVKIGSFDGTLTIEEIVSVLLTGLPALSLLLYLLRESFICCMRLQCLKELLLRIEIHAELAAMDGSVRRAFQQAKAGSPKPEGPEAYRPSPMSRKRNANVAAMSHSMISAEHKAAASKGDDRSKTTKGGALVPSTMHAPRQAPRNPKYKTPGKGRKAPSKGKATLVYPGDGVYEGEYVDGRKQGRGKFWYVSGSVYEGSWMNDEKHGKGKETYNDGATYEGKFHEGCRHGPGVLTYANRDVYDGEWDMDVKHGYGTFRWSAGTVYEGEWESGVMHGTGTYYFADGCTYQGQYADGKRNGRGVYRFLDGSFFEGEYRDGVVEGRGTFTFADGSAEVGRWEDGQPIGEATRFSPDHKAAWRLFDGVVTGPVNLDLADVIAQMAFRPKAARLARAVRDQLALVHMEEERSRQKPASANFGMRALRSSSPPPLAERPAWSGVMDVALQPRAFSPSKPAATSKPSPPPGYGLPDRYQA